MRTVVVSDLHLGTRSGSDLLRRPEVRAALLDALEPGDRLLILGDGLELREAAHRDAAPVMAPLLAGAGERLGAEGEIVVVAGNHDHGLIAGWMESRLQAGPPGFLGLEQRIAPHDAGPLAEAMAQAAAPARLEFAYPGVWLREDVYAIHGHYCDLHSTVPTFERLAAGAMERWVARIPQDGARPDDYEAALSPIYAWLHQIAQRSGGTVREGGGASTRAWVALSGGGRGGHRIRRAALGAGYVAAISALNRAGIGPLERNLSGPALRRGTLNGFKESLRRLDIRAPYVIWGHSHRSGPWPGDDLSEWFTHAGGRILNTGSWTYQPHFVAGSAPATNPYWPGPAVVVGDTGPPELIRLLGALDPA